MDREIHNTTVLVIGSVGPYVLAALKERALDTLALADIAPGATVKKFIRYAAGNFAGIFGARADGFKLIVNAHVVLVGMDAVAELTEVLADVGIGPPVTDQGQALLVSGDVLPGVYLVGENFDSAGAIAYALERLAHFQRAGESMNRPREMHIGGVYTLDILRPKLKVLHKLFISNDKGTLTGTYVTENDSQPMQDLACDGQYLTWNAYSGTTSSELFTYRLELFDDILLGATWRIDGGCKAVFKSPVVVERIQK